MTMFAGKVAQVADIDLERFGLSPYELQVMVGEYLLKPVHVVT